MCAEGERHGSDLVEQMWRGDDVENARQAGGVEHEAFEVRNVLFCKWSECSGGELGAREAQAEEALPAV